MEFLNTGPVVVPDRVFTKEVEDNEIGPIVGLFAGKDSNQEYLPRPRPSLFPLGEPE